MPDEPAVEPREDDGWDTVPPSPTVADDSAAEEPAGDLAPMVEGDLVSVLEEAVREAGGPERLPGEPEPDPVLEAVERVARIGERVERKLADLEGRFDREVRAEATREKVVDRLHSELQEYKQGLLLSAMRPVFVDLIQLHDDIGKVAAAPGEGEGAAEGEGENATESEAAAVARRYVALLKGFQQGIEDVLYRQGVEPFQTEGDAFDPRQQRAIATAPTEDPALNKTVAARHRKGFRAGDRVIRPEVVSVYALKRPV
jgi:molecular chaperone GrpE